MENNLNNTKTVNEPRVAHEVADDEISLREILSAIWQGKWVIITITIIFSVAFTLYAIKQPNIYKSEVLLAPAEEDQKGGLGALAGQFGGLASLAGVSLNSGGIDKTQMAIQVLKSRKFTNNFIQKYNILPDLMAAEGWNQENNGVVYNQELYLSNENKWVRKVTPPLKAEPSMQEAYKEFSKVLNVNVNKENGMVVISIEHVSPFVAQRWVNWIIQDINQTMKERDVLEANKSTDFLIKQIQETKIADIRSVLYKLVEEQTKTIMFASVRDEYVFKTIDPAIVPEKKFKPNRAVICILGFILGLLISSVYVLIRYFIKQDSRA
ncbi:LPS O-antigen length regulator [Pseudoalteromonas sp. S3776]|uniref:Wzz/FepE/Etk N-terminal domain-containing protein n=1 Tax=Pseudoalteromonas sp. S3776 TaxID=579544 RepID=UPI0011084124|nr:Wzz/FepE/Etk N-terminal domain-containing protein [Pseudoalteromonas sp. S3776]TMO79721.1 LPS O-antigen length regulator [Pseudoalteromonas sp. S3776]